MFKRKQTIVNIWSLCIFGFTLAFPAHAKINGKIVLGFSQIGAESAWRIANTKSIKEAAREADIILDFSDAFQKQENQIKAIKSFIIKKVDVIAFAPVVTSGWHEVLVQAKHANIPVIISDRDIDEKDPSLYTSFIGSDFREEGRKAGKCLWDTIKKQNLSSQINIIELRGTEGSAPATQRKLGFEEILREHPQMKLIRSENGDFKENLGKELMEKIIKEETSKNIKINALFAHNDNMALGAIASIEAAGLRPGKDIYIVSIDGVKEAFVAMTKGKINCTAECSPLLGPQLMKAVKEVVAGKKLPKKIISEESVFTSENAEKELPNRQY